LYGLLEHDTAHAFIDEFAEVPIDASQVIWVATANDARGIPDPILNRMNVFEIEAPDEEAARKIASKLYASIRSEHEWGQRFDPDLADDVLDAMSHCAPREMRRALMTAFGNAKLDGRGQIDVQDLPDQHARRKPIGFVQ
jgi:ATP-dependent Lon protease